MMVFQFHKNFSKVKNQFIAVICANLATVGAGCGLGWLSPALVTLQSDETPLTTGQLSVDEISWLGSLTQLFGICVFPLFVVLTKHLGRKLTIASMVVPLIASWLLILFATNVIYLYVSRLTIGCTVSGALICIPLMVAEIADDNVRGILGAMLSASQYLGILYMYIIGEFIPYAYMPYAVLPIPIIFFLTFIFVPESPLYLMQQNKLKEAERSLKFFKNCNGNTKEDLHRFQTEMDKILLLNKKTNIQENKIVFADFTTSAALRAFAMGTVLMYIYGFCGFVVLLMYGANIFRDSGSDFDPNVSTIVMGSAQLMGTLSAVVLIDKFGRRILYMASTSGATVCMFLAGLYTYLGEIGYSLDGFSWVPVVTISLALFSICIGIVPVSIVLMAELLPAKIRSVGSMVMLLLMALSLASASKIFPIISEAAGLWVTLWIFSANTLIGLLFGIFIMQETKGKQINVEN